MKHDVLHVCERCLTCKMAKSRVSSKCLFTPLPIPTTPLIDIFMDFKITYFIPCHKNDDACHIADFFFKEVVRLHKHLKSIVFRGKEFKILGNWLPHIEFSYNRVVNKITSHSPFELVYRSNPLSLLDLIPLYASKADLEGLSKA
ncbi:hypothetical protein CR513_15396, partial [Mucuna pruriens]